MKNSVMKVFLFTIFTLIVLFSISCQTSTEQKPVSEPPKTQSNDAGGIKVEIKTDPEFIEAGKEVTLSLTIKNDKDEVIKDLQITHEKPMHLIAVSQDLEEFYHLHPELSFDGSYKIKHTFPYGGRYTLYLDLTLPGGQQNVQIIGVGVVGKERPKTELKADAALVKTVDGLRVEMKPDGELAAGKPAMLKFNLTDAATNKPPAAMEKYLGEDAHFVIISQDLKEFVHAHPMSETENAAPEISAHVVFPKGGLYKIWAQFQRAGKVIAVPFVVQAKAAEDEVDLSKVEIPNGTIRVTVSKEGFTPKAIEVKAGHPVTLAFIRIDQENCGTEVVFPSLNIKKELPLGQVVTIDIPAGKPGDFNFACGMDMLKGIVMVE
jgi:hypothetical protein